MESDNLISVKEVTATDAARRFSELLDAVEHDGDSFTIVRHGKAIAEVNPVPAASGEALLRVLREVPVDGEFAEDVVAMRALLTDADRWPD